MRPRDIVLAVAVAAAWGFNFVVIEIGLDHYPAAAVLARCASALAAVPGDAVRRPAATPWRWIIAVGLRPGRGEVLAAVRGHGRRHAGRAVLAGAAEPGGLHRRCSRSLLLRERPGRRRSPAWRWRRSASALVAARLGRRPAGRGVRCWSSARRVAWGAVQRGDPRAAPPDMLRFMVWVSAVASPPLIVLSLAVRGPGRRSGRAARARSGGLGACSTSRGSRRWPASRAGAC